MNRYVPFAGRSKPRWYWQLRQSSKAKQRRWFHSVPPGRCLQPDCLSSVESAPLNVRACYQRCRQSMGKGLSCSMLGPMPKTVRIIYCNMPLWVATMPKTCAAWLIHVLACLITVQKQTKAISCIRRRMIFWPPLRGLTLSGMLNLVTF